MTSPLASGLSDDCDFFFARCPDQPELRESSSLWLFEQSGRFGFPRLGIEAEASRWEQRRVQANFAFSGGRVLNGAGVGAAHSPFDAESRPAILGAGPLAFRCLIPFRRWLLTYDGSAVDGTVTQQLAGTVDLGARVPLRLVAELEMAAPAWVQDNSPQRVAELSPQDALEAANMGIGLRFEQLLRARGVLRIDGEDRPFEGVGLRIKRQSVRPLEGFRGHCWQSALFPDGRAFGYVAYPPRADGHAYNAGYVIQDGQLYPARATRIPWLRRLSAVGEDVSVELEWQGGSVRVEGATTLSTFRVANPDLPGLHLHQGGARYTWESQVALGMIERSSQVSLVEVEP